MGAKLAKQRLSRRIVALIAAYALALSAVVGSIASARAAAATIGGEPGAVICHTDVSGGPSPDSNGSTNQTCPDCCGLCCLSLAATVPAPSGDLIFVLRTTSRIPRPQPILALFAKREAHLQQPRAPPSV